jgi:site-specific recombinase XerC
MGKTLASQALDRIGKKWDKAKSTREGTLQHIKAFAKFTEHRFGLEKIENLKPGHVQEYVRNMQEKGLSAGTIANRLSGIRLLAKSIAKQNIVCRENKDYDISRVRQNPVLANRDLINSIKTELASRASQGNRVAKMSHAAAVLRDAFGLRAKESIMTSKVYDHCGALRLQVEGAKGGRPRELMVRTPDQIKAVQLVTEISKALGSGTGRIIPPELSLKGAYDAQRQLWSSLGGTRVNRAHMHAQRHDYLQRMREKGASNKEIMRDAGHGENRSPGSYIPK